ncbi:ACC synthase-like protein [Aphelenchoides besseyi]|nr:ACC synthase-like protein [Aphelenchoides besseyi]KAI6200036.1 ACC synthase-like protein [Aphelenchoides besseyi]
MSSDPFHTKLLSHRAQRGLRFSSTGPQNALYLKDPYTEQNTTGYIKLSSADNVLCQEIVEKKFREIDWSNTLQTMANFINKFCRPSLKPINWEEVENILLLVPGVTTCADLLSQVLFDVGEVLLIWLIKQICAPYYYRFANDFGERGLVDIQIVTALSEDGKRTELKVERFEEAYQRALQNGHKVRALTLVNPQNPEGDYFSIDELRPIIKWALEKKIFVILDEIYDLSIYDENPAFPFRSACELFEDPEAANYLIWIWGISKNFSLPGLRFAVIYSPNPAIRTASSRFVMHHIPNTTTQFIAREFLNDYDWIQNVFLPENHRRLKDARDHLLNLLKTLEVPFIKPRAGFFVLYLDAPTWEAERELNRRFFENRVMITAGETCYCPKPGYFRIVFSSLPRKAALTEVTYSSNAAKKRFSPRPRLRIFRPPGVMISFSSPFKIGVLHSTFTSESLSPLSSSPSSLKMFSPGLTVDFLKFLWVSKETNFV